MRLILAALFIGHGVAHVVGFAVPWKLVTSSQVPYRTTVAGGLVDIGPAGVRLVGLLWLFVAVALVSIAAGVLQHTTWWYREALVILMVSSVLCLLGWPDSRPGLVANFLILAVLIGGSFLGWFPDLP
jgi:ABC-type microcin C transport system permease subunit YejB